MVDKSVNRMEQQDDEIRVLKSDPRALTQRVMIGRDCDI